MNGATREGAEGTHGGAEGSQYKKYLLRFPLHLKGLRYGELDSILDMIGLNPKDCYDHSEKERAYHFLVVRLPSDEAAAELARRGVLISGVYELWGMGETLEEMLRDIEGYVDDEVRRRYFGPEVTWSIVVDAVGYSHTVPEQNELRRIVYGAVPFEGDVAIKNPAVRYVVISNYIPCSAVGCGSTSETLQHIFFGREVLANTGRVFVGQDDLKRRAFLGPTSLPSELALLMANMAQVKRGGLVLDPFVGTGSILIACARFGAFCMGTDIDIRILRGKKGRTPFTNFRQYGLPLPELLRSDNSLYEGHFRVQPLYDAIVSDPPYGIRAGARRSGSRRETVNDVPSELREEHIPMTRPYPVNDVMTDLLRVAARSLLMHGRLVYLLPWCPLPELEPDQFIPTHPCLEFVTICDQPLTTKLVRKVIVMKKIKEPEDGDPLPGRLDGDGREYMDVIVPAPTVDVVEEQRI